MDCNALWTYDDSRPEFIPHITPFTNLQYNTQSMHKNKPSFYQNNHKAVWNFVIYLRNFCILYEFKSNISSQRFLFICVYRTKQFSYLLYNAVFWGQLNLKLCNEYIYRAKQGTKSMHNYLQSMGHMTCKLSLNLTNSRKQNLLPS